jgi:hypothetical protein
MTDDFEIGMGSRGRCEYVPVRLKPASLPAMPLTPHTDPKISEFSLRTYLCRGVYLIGFVCLCELSWVFCRQNCVVDAPEEFAGEFVGCQAEE